MDHNNLDQKHVIITRCGEIELPNSNDLISVFTRSVVSQFMYAPTTTHWDAFIYMHYVVVFFMKTWSFAKTRFRYP